MILLLLMQWVTDTDGDEDVGDYDNSKRGPF